MKILIVDDEPLVRKSLQRAFVAKGHEVFLAADGREGLKLWLETLPDVVFLDVLMPGMSGPELLREIGIQCGKSWCGRTILMSAYSGEHNVETAQQMGADLFIPKPFEDIFAVVRKVENLVASSKNVSQ